MKAHKNEGTMKPQYETRLALLEQNNVHIHETLKRIDNNIIVLNQHLADSLAHITNRMDARFDQMERKFDQKFELVDRKFELIDKKLDAVNTKIDSNFKYIITTMLTLFVASGLLPVLSSLLQKFIH